MSQHIKSLFHQLQPLLFNNHNNNNNQYTANTPKTDNLTKTARAESTSTASRKIHLTIKGGGSKKRKLHFGDVETPVLSDVRAEQRVENSDSGLDVTPAAARATGKPTISYNCKQCLHRLNYANEMERKLKQAHVKYVKSNLNELHFANVPMLVVKSYKPTSGMTTTAEADSSPDKANNKLIVRRGVPVNALFLIDNKWLYVKTTGEQKGFIPKKCCEPFADSTINHANHLQRRQKTNTKRPASPRPPSIAPVDHTYATIVNTDAPAVTNHTNLSLFSVSQSNKQLKSQPDYENLNVQASKFYDNLADFKSNENAARRGRSWSSSCSLSEYDCLTDSPAPAASNTCSSSITTISPLDLNYFESSSASNNVVPGGVLSTTSNHYDQLMRYNKVNYNATSTSEAKMIVYRVVRSFRSNSNGYLSVNKGDLVVGTTTTDERDYLLVRMFQKKAQEPVIYENDAATNDRHVQIGYVPSSHLTRLTPQSTAAAAVTSANYPLTSSVYSSSSSTGTSLSSRSSSPIY